MFPKGGGNTKNMREIVSKFENAKSYGANLWMRKKYRVNRRCSAAESYLGQEATARSQILLSNTTIPPPESSVCGKDANTPVTKRKCLVGSRHRQES